MAKNLSFDHFCECAKDFVVLSDKFGDGWVLDSDGGEEVYLKKRACILMREYQSSDVDLTDVDITDNVCVDSDSVDFSDSVDSSTVDVDRAGSPVHCQYEVRYSESYSVPVLYCRMWDSSGALLELGKVWQMAPPAARGWSQLTLVAHPIADTPWIQVHPCKTASIMGEMDLISNPSQSRTTTNYIVSFLSVYGPAVGLRVTQKYLETSRINRPK